ncbi:hypothetical protein KIN20_016386 [Parelaphostrongylus tenuis]|uniref:Uncharacterized protein n=1 Tax=Parelaphostrongylus tenuis TaxID=148309 RepID=A0AAD5QPR1_PARTN|nr:hypothetical protein KIN20_016386 [Parelaphostrongylus tenuis]
MLTLEYNVKEAWDLDHTSRGIVVTILTMVLDGPSQYRTYDARAHMMLTIEVMIQCCAMSTWMDIDMHLDLLKKWPLFSE